MVKSKKIYIYQNFVHALTGKFYVHDDEEDCVKEIHDMLKLYGIETEENPLWDYPLDEIEHIVENNLNVVLVDVSEFDDEGRWITEYRWFEVPEGFKDEDE